MTKENNQELEAELLGDESITLENKSSASSVNWIMKNVKLEISKNTRSDLLAVIDGLDRSNFGDYVDYTRSRW